MVSWTYLCVYFPKTAMYDMIPHNKRQRGQIPWSIISSFPFISPEYQPLSWTCSPFSLLPSVYYLSHLAAILLKCLRVCGVQPCGEAERCSKNRERKYVSFAVWVQPILMVPEGKVYIRMRTRYQEDIHEYLGNRVVYAATWASAVGSCICPGISWGNSGHARCFRGIWRLWHYRGSQKAQGRFICESRVLIKVRISVAPKVTEWS